MAAPPTILATTNEHNQQQPPTHDPNLPPPNSTTITITTTPKKETKTTSFVPTELASTHLNKVISDYESANLHNKQLSVKLQAAHKATEEYYVQLLRDTKNRAIRVIDSHKLRIVEDEQKHSAFKSESEINIKGLKEQLLNKQLEFNKLLGEKINSDSNLALARFKGSIHDTVQTNRYDEVEKHAGAVEEELELGAEQRQRLESELDKLTAKHVGQAFKHVVQEKKLARSGSEKAKELGIIIEDDKRVAEENQTTAKSLEEDLTEKAAQIIYLTNHIAEMQNKNKELQNLVDKTNKDKEDTLLQKSNLIDANELSLKDKAAKIVELNEAVMNNEAAHNASKLHYDVKIEDLKTNLHSASSLAIQLKKEVKDARGKSDFSADKLYALENECNSKVAEVDAVRMKLATLESEVATYRSSASELALKLEEAEAALITADANARAAVSSDREMASLATNEARDAAEKVTLIQLAVLEQVENEEQATRLEINDAGEKVDNLTSEINELKKEDPDETSSGNKILIDKLELQLSEAKAVGAASSEKLEKHEAEGEKIRKALEERAASAETSAEELREKAAALSSEFLSASTKNSSDLESLEAKFSGAKDAANAASSRASTLATQVELLGSKESETLAAKDEAFEKVASLSAHVQQLKLEFEESTVKASKFTESEKKKLQADLVKAEEMVIAERKRLMVIEAKAVGFEAKNLAKEEEFKALHAELKKQEHARNEVAAATAVKDREKFSALEEVLTDSQKKSDEVRSKLESEAADLAKELERTFAELHNFDLESKSAQADFEKKISELSDVITTSEDKMTALRAEMLRESELSFETSKDLKILLEQALGTSISERSLRDAAEHKLSELEWKRKEEFAKAAKIPKEENKAPNTNIASESQIIILKQENEKLKKNLLDAQEEGRSLLNKASSELALSGAASPQPRSSRSSLLVASASSTKSIELSKQYEDSKIATKKAEAEKKASKDGIKSWLADFEKENGAPASNSDKASILNKYTELKELEEKLKVLKEVEKGLKAQVTTLLKEEASATPPVAVIQQTAHRASVFAIVEEKVAAPLSAKELLEEEVSAARDQRKASEKEKKALKDKIKQWLADFETTNGSPPTNADKSAIVGKYTLLKELEAKVKMLVEAESALKEKLEAAKSSAALEAAAAANPQSTPPATFLPTSDPELGKKFDSLTARNNELTKINADLSTALKQLKSSIEVKETATVAEKSELNSEIEKFKELNTESNFKLEKATLRLDNLLENGDDLMKFEIEEAKKEAETNKLAMYEAQTFEKKTKLTLDLTLSRAEMAERSLGELRDAAPLSASEEVNKLRQQIALLEKDIVRKAKSSVAGWEKLAEAEEENEHKVDEAMKEGMEEGAKRSEMKLGIQANQMKTINAELDRLKEKLDELQAKEKSMKVKLSDFERTDAEKDRLVAELRNKVAEDAAGVANARSNTPRDEEEDGGDNNDGDGAAVEGNENTDNAGGVDEEESSISPQILAKVLEVMQDTTKSGTDLWRAKKKAECYNLYKKTCLSVLSDMPDDYPARSILQASYTAALNQQPAAGAVMIRKAFDAFLSEKGGITMGKSDSSTGPIRSPSTQGLASAAASNTTSNATSNNSTSSGGVSNAAMQKALKQIKTLEAAVKSSQSEITSLKSKLEKSESAAKDASDNTNSAAIAKRQSDILEKKFGKVSAESDKKHADEVSALTKKLKKQEDELTKAKEELEAASKENSDLAKRSGNMKVVEKELEAIKLVADEVPGLKKAAAQSVRDIEKLTADYQEEKGLRKKYWNMMEDMKGKIRVYARCRPFAKYEKEKKCENVVRFIDDTTMEVTNARGPKDYTFDGVFSPSQSQEEVYEDTKMLITSAFDGYNVCLFAYGQTGSGKTWTMTGDIHNRDNEGITPRAMRQLFEEVTTLRTKGVAEVTISTYFVELYNDTLIDLFFKLDNPKSKEIDMLKLEVKVDASGTVLIKNAIIKEVKSKEELHMLFEKGNKARHVGSTLMNAESSRSHSIFSIMIDSKDLNTGKTSRGKLTLVDLAGSERADKTGATGDRLQEAKSINVSLSALGDVISALSTNQKFIPYRNNKLTQVLQDGLGGNAKTLMFVNISPADYNADETMSSLGYAARVKMIKNTATKAQDSEEVSRLNKLVERLRNGEKLSDEEIDGTAK